MKGLEWAWALINEPFSSEDIVAAQLADEITEAEVAVKLWTERLKLLRGEGNA